MRVITVKLDDADWSALETLRNAVNRRRRKAVAMSTVLRMALSAGLDAHKEVIEKAATAPLPPPAAPRARWQAFVAPFVAETAGRALDRDQLAARCNTLFETRGVRPPQFAQELAALDPSLGRSVAFNWYYRGELPSDAEAAQRLLRAVEAWIDALSADEPPKARKPFARSACDVASALTIGKPSWSPLSRAAPGTNDRTRP